MSNPHGYEAGFTIEQHRDELIERLGKAIRRINELESSDAPVPPEEPKEVHEAFENWWWAKQPSLPPTDELSLLIDVARDSWIASRKAIPVSQSQPQPEPTVRESIEHDNARIADTVSRGAFFQDWRLAALAAKKGHRGLMVTTAGDFVILTDLQEMELRNAAKAAPVAQPELDHERWPRPLLSVAQPESVELADDYRSSKFHLSNSEVRSTGILCGGAVQNIARELLELRTQLAVVTSQRDALQTQLANAYKEIARMQK